VRPRSSNFGVARPDFKVGLRLPRPLLVGQSELSGLLTALALPASALYDNNYEIDLQQDARLQVRAARERGITANGLNLLRFSVEKAGS
jgi:hypothetical protein